MTNTSCEQTRMLRDIGIIDFTLVELTLYLDTHPHDKQAMEYFNHYARIKHQMVKDYSDRYYPLMKDSSTETRDWKWALAPMPWENMSCDNCSWDNTSCENRMKDHMHRRNMTSDNYSMEGGYR